MAEPTWADYQRKQAALRANLQNKNSGGQTKGKGAPGWAMRMRYFFLDQTPRRIRLVPCSDTPGEEFYRYYARWATRANPSGGKDIRREVISTSHNGEFDVPDLAFWYALNREDAKLFGQPKDAITVVELCEFHEYQKPSADGKKTYPELRHCNGLDRFNKSNCRDCDNKLPKIFGRQRYMSMNPKGKEDLIAELENLRNRCANPACNGGELQVFQYNCLDCGVALLNLYEAAATGEDITGDISDLEAAADTGSEDLIVCPSCCEGDVKKTGVKVARQYECRVVKGTSVLAGCKNPTRLPDDLSIFDIDFVATSEAYKIHILEFEPRKAYPGAAPTMNVPMPLHTFLSHQTLSEQAAALGITAQAFIAETGETAEVLEQKIQTFVASRT